VKFHIAMQARYHDLFYCVLCSLLCAFLQLEVYYVRCKSVNVVPLPLPHGRPAVRMPVDQQFAEWSAVGHRVCHLSVDWPSVPQDSESSVVGVSVGLSVGVIAWTVLQVEMLNTAWQRDGGTADSVRLT
jgi:hypothetical protein